MSLGTTYRRPDLDKWTNSESSDGQLWQHYSISQSWWKKHEEVFLAAEEIDVEKQDG